MAFENVPGAKNKHHVKLQVTERVQVTIMSDGPGDAYVMFRTGGATLSFFPDPDKLREMAALLGYLADVATVTVANPPPITAEVQS